MTLGCITCGQPLSQRTLDKVASGLPISGECRTCWREARRKPKACSDCAAPISRMSKGRCWTCAARVRETNLEIRAKRIEAVRRSLLNPEILAKKQAVSRANGRAHLKWLPEKFEAEYRRLRKRTGLSAPAARLRIEAKMTPFERQLARVMAGARLVTVQPAIAPGNQRIAREVIL